LGHPVDHVLDVLRHTLSFDNKNTELICDTCQRAKQTREPFPLSDHVSTELGELVHLDLWEPDKVTSREGFKFFLTIVDDFSRAVWVYLLKSKTEVFYNIMVFYNLIKTQFKKNIKVFRRDNGTEFVNQQFSGFYESNVYNKHLSLKHLRSFGCLAYATILNSHDKFGSRDVKFFEDIFPFKQNSSIGIDKPVQDVNHLNFLTLILLMTYLKYPMMRREGTLALSGMDADASASKNESFAADEDKNNSSEGNGLHDQTQDNVSQDNNGVQNL
ncbi:ribonuclease H-like domain-containing protein, partial [Tanacetum coccineum]